MILSRITCPPTLGSGVLEVPQSLATLMIGVILFQTFFPVFEIFTIEILKDLLKML